MAYLSLSLVLRGKLAAGVAAAALTAASLSFSARAADVAPEIGAVDALQALFGKHPGVRSNHAKGTVLDATFTPTPEAAALSKASLFAGAPVKVTVRFSDPSGNPDIADNDPGANPHGMALKFHLADKSEMDIAMISRSTFPIPDAAGFRDLFVAIAATKADSPKPSPIEQYMGAHPAVLAWVQSMPATPASLANESFYGLNAFRFIARDGKVSNVRYRFVPVAGDAPRLTKDDLAKKSATFLMDDIKERAKAGTAKFKWIVQVGGKDDKTSDVTVNWPDDRKLVTLGELNITAASADSAKEEKGLVFMPAQAPDGIEASDDPMITARSAAYAESYGRRQ